eukprot:3268427-Alexandrium_andersonii.AAC.1
MSASLVGSEMCIRDRPPALVRTHGAVPPTSGRSRLTYVWHALVHAMYLRNQTSLRLQTILR